MAGSTHAKHAQYAILIRRGDEGGVGEVPLPLGLLLGQDVTLVGMLALDLTRTGDLETLLGARVRFYFRHGKLFIGFIG